MMPIGPANQVMMLTNYIILPRPSSPSRTKMSCTGWVGCLRKEPVVMQVPICNRFGPFRYTTRARTKLASLGCSWDQAGFLYGRGAELERHHSVRHCWRGGSSTAFAVTMPRIFMDDTPEDHAAICGGDQIQIYPLSQFDGKMKTIDWSKLPDPPMPKETARPQYSTKQPPRFTRRCSSTNHQPS